MTCLLRKHSPDFYLSSSCLAASLGLGWHAGLHYTTCHTHTHTSPSITLCSSHRFRCHAMLEWQTHNVLVCSDCQGQSPGLHQFVGCTWAASARKALHAWCHAPGGEPSIMDAAIRNRDLTECAKVHSLLESPSPFCACQNLATYCLCTHAHCGVRQQPAEHA